MLSNKLLDGRRTAPRSNGDETKEPPLTDGGSSLPDDLLTDQTNRIQVLCGLGILLWSINLAMDVYISPQGDRGPYRLVIEGLGVAFSALVFFITRFRHCSYRTTVNVGIACMVPHALGLALLNSWTEQPTTMRPISGITTLILLFGMMAPARPGRILAAALVSASMDPLGVWLAHLRGLPVPPVLKTLIMFYPNYVCAILAVAPARILYRLGRQLREARALGSYELVELLGKGGMGEVWLGRHRLLARDAAIKLVRPDMIGDSAEEAARTLSRFEREAQSTAALNSPHTIRLFDFGLTKDGTFYYVMELLDGQNLEAVVRRFGSLTPARALFVLEQVCRSLAEAHARGLIHRDIKPANIFLCRMGLDYDFVKVLDFGLAKVEDRSLATTMVTSDLGVGTPAYMAPEAILGEGPIDRKVDVYAFGCVAYFLLTGRLVFEGSSRVKVLMEHVHGRPTPASHHNPAVPFEVDELILWCLRKAPHERPDIEQALRIIKQISSKLAWDQESAKLWWEQHLPESAQPTVLSASAIHHTERVLALSMARQVI